VTDPLAIIADIDAAILETAPEALPALIAALSSTITKAAARQMVAATDRTHKTSMHSAPDQCSRLLTSAEAAEIARQPVRWLNRRTKNLRFRRDLSRKKILYDEKGLRNWISAQSLKTA
jgi:hypothetical protein